MGTSTILSSLAALRMEEEWARARYSAASPLYVWKRSRHEHDTQQPRRFANGRGVGTRTILSSLAALRMEEEWTREDMSAILSSLVALRINGRGVGTSFLDNSALCVCYCFHPGTSLSVLRVCIESLHKLPSDTAFSFDRERTSIASSYRSYIFVTSSLYRSPTRL